MRIQENHLGSIAAKYYTQILDQCFSEDGKCVISINSFGHIITCPCPSNDGVSSGVSIGKIQTNLELRCGKSLANVLICGSSDGIIHGFNWTSLSECVRTNATMKAAPSFSERLASSAIEDILPLDSDKKFAIGCADGLISVHDVEVSKKQICVFHGHSQKINKLAKRSEFEFVSCSNDGLVQFWDSRVSKKPPRTLQIASHSQATRPKFSSGIYAVDVDDDFVVCGGGVNLSLWHLSSSSLARILKNGEDSDQQEICSAVEMVDGQILAGATAFSTNSTLYRYNYSGSSILSLKINMNNIRNIHTTESTSPAHKLSVLSGDSSQLFFLTDFGFVSSAINTTKSVDETV